MTAPPVRALAPGRTTRILWGAAALFLLVLAGSAGYELQRSRGEARLRAAREIETLARVFSQEVTRSLQGVDIPLRTVSVAARDGALPAESRALHDVLRTQRDLFGDIRALTVTDAQGNVLASSAATPPPPGRYSDRPLFRVLAQKPHGEAYADNLARNARGEWELLVGRRLEAQGGRFDGIVAAALDPALFGSYFSSVRLGEGESVALVHDDGTVVASYPARGGTGSPSPAFAALRAAGPDPRVPAVIRGADGRDQFAALRPVPGFPLQVLVTLDEAGAMRSWREQAAGVITRTLLLALAAAIAVAVVLAQLRRVQEARQRLDASEERFRVAAEGAMDGIWDWDIPADRCYVSPRGAEIVGLAATPAIRSRQEWLAAIRFHPDDVADCEGNLAGHLEGRLPRFDVELRVLATDGAARWVRVTGLCRRDAAGQPVRMAGSLSDIDRRRRAEEELREQAQLLDLTLDSMFVRDRDDVIRFWNRGAQEAYGWSAREAIGKRAHDLLKTRFPLPLEAIRERLRREGRWEGELVHTARDGRVLLVSSRWAVQRDERGEVAGILESNNDITLRKQAEESLRESEQRYALAAAGANEGLWDWSLGDDSVYLSERAQQLLGLQGGAARRPRRAWRTAMDLHPDDAPTVRAAVAAHLRGDSPHLDVEFRLRPRAQAPVHGAEDGWTWVRQRGLAVHDATGKPQRMAGSVENVTPRKQAERERAALETQLRQAQKLEAIGTLAGGIAHDFNNILGAILGYAELARAHASDGTDQARQIDGVLGAGQRAKGLVERILAFSRAGMGERVPVHVQSVVGEALDLLLPSLPAGITLTRQLAAGDAAVIGDPAQIHQVAMNLCTNAMQSMESGGVLAVVLDLRQAEAGRVLATGPLPPGDYVRLSVRDHGPGIAPDVLHRIFDPFFTTKGVGAGTGLGLSLVHGIVTELGGGIDVRSRPGEGAEFEVWLPWFGRAAVAVEGGDDLSRGGGERVLLVDDEAALVRVGEEMIAVLGYEPVGFTSSTEALLAFEADPHRFDAVLSDETMPELTGSQLAARIRALRSDIPIVLMSGYVGPAMAALARGSGVSDILAKPLVSRDIARVLAAVLRR